MRVLEPEDVSLVLVDNTGIRANSVDGESHILVRVLGEGVIDLTESSEAWSSGSSPFLDSDINEKSG